MPLGNVGSEFTKSNMPLGNVGSQFTNTQQAGVGLSSISANTSYPAQRKRVLELKSCWALALMLADEADRQKRQDYHRKGHAVRDVHHHRAISE